MRPMKAAPWLRICLAALAAAELLGLVLLCESQMERAEARRQVERVQDAVFGYCLDQFSLNIARCRRRFVPEP